MLMCLFGIVGIFWILIFLSELFESCHYYPSSDFPKVNDLFKVLFYWETLLIYNVMQTTNACHPPSFEVQGCKVTQNQ